MFAVVCCRAPGAHPRSRGEHSGLALEQCRALGSSPLARGTRGGVMRWRDTVGLIPARAGNTCFFFRRDSIFRAHPRSRGEHLPAGQEALAREGSSPLARGTLKRVAAEGLAGGLIPARAGNTLSAVGFAVHYGAHPRSRGEHTQAENSLSAPLGSSPLARGTRPSEARALNARGLIPARAGNTPALSPPATQPRAHPRSRGEHTKTLASLSGVVGSSPLARGTR